MPALTITRPQAPAQNGSSSSERTNTLIVTNLPRVFFHPSVLQALRDHFATYGEIHAWAPLRSFGRIIIVYYEEQVAERVKFECDNLTVDATSTSPKTTMRVFRADPTPIHSFTSASPSAISPFHLRPPALEKNFLISPPGSPPVGWEQIREDPPNSSPLANDLITALRKLQIAQTQESFGLGGVRQDSSVSVLVEPNDGAGVGVYVEDCDQEMNMEEDGDGAHEEMWIYGNSRRQQMVPIPTSMPPMRMTA